ncbi:hypothetical protein AB3G45_03700 [Shinella sp. S4-D37]|uniref:hypothetical protein n=1 Tax=Shinella sp. S4-D37 TaxID=3161999 RepID=UPI0034658F77
MQALIGMARSRVMLLIAAAGAAGKLSIIPARAQDDHSIYYGSRAGMHVTTVSKSGIGTSKAVIMIKHTPK